MFFSSVMMVTSLFWTLLLLQVWITKSLQSVTDKFSTSLLPYLTVIFRLMLTSNIMIFYCLVRYIFNEQHVNCKSKCYKNTTTEILTSKNQWNHNSTVKLVREPPDNLRMVYLSLVLSTNCNDVIRKINSS